MSLLARSRSVSRVSPLSRSRFAQCGATTGVPTAHRKETKDHPGLPTPASGPLTDAGSGESPFNRRLPQGPGRIPGPQPGVIGAAGLTGDLSAPSRTDSCVDASESVPAYPSSPPVDDLDALDVAVGTKAVPRAESRFESGARYILRYDAQCRAAAALLGVPRRDGCNRTNRSSGRSS